LIINPIEIVESDAEVRLQSLIEFSDKKKYLWYSLPKKFSQYLMTEKLDGFLVGVLLLAMKLGEDIEVKGAVSERLYFNLTNSYMKIMQILIPELIKVNINPQYLDNGKTTKCEGAVVTGFSAGVDSFSTIYDHYLNDPLPDYKITHFVFNNVGSHGVGDSEKTRALFNARYDLVKGYPREIGIDFIKIDSNLSEVLEMDYEQTHFPRNVSAILLLQKLFAKYYYSSSLQYKDCSIKPYYDMAITDPVAVHLLSTETLECISTGCQYSRVEKTRRLAKLPGANRWLNVCVKPSPDGKNCSTCWKCCRTLLTLEILGLLEDFGQVFSLDKWKRVKNRYLLGVIGNSKDLYAKEIIDYARIEGYPFKPWLVVASRSLNFSLGNSALSLFHFLEIIKKKINPPPQSK
jgi:hypothetical protein